MKKGFKILTFKANLIGLIPIFLVMMATGGICKEYIIYTIAQEVSTGEPQHKPKRNFYLNMGSNQGLQKGTLLDVYRMTSKLDPYNNTRYQYRVKVGELKVLHTESDAAIAKTYRLSQGDSAPLFDISDFMIGDQVSIHVKE